MIDVLQLTVSGTVCMSVKQPSRSWSVARSTCMHECYCAQLHSLASGVGYQLRDSF